MIKRLVDCWRILTGRYRNYFIVAASDEELKKVTEPHSEWNVDIRFNRITAPQFYFLLMGILSGMNDEMNSENK